MNNYSLNWEITDSQKKKNWGITIHLQNGCNNYSLVDVIISNINIFPNK